MKRSNHFILAIGVMAGLLFLDQATKWVAVHYIRDANFSWRSWGDLFRIVYAENTGAFLGLGGNLSPSMRTLVMVGMNGVILTTVGVWLVLSRSASMLVPVSLAMILSGGLGNLVDRVFNHGRVIDFMNMGITLDSFSLRTGIFNVADMAIMGGLFLLLYNEFFGVRVPPSGDGGNTARKEPSDGD